jgi:hypothetical protein
MARSRTRKISRQSPKILSRTKIKELLTIIYKETKPHDAWWQFMNMATAGLVLMGVKKGAFIYGTNDKINKALEKEGLFTTVNGDEIFLSYKDPHLTEQSTHEDIGKVLSYLTPLDISSNLKTKGFGIKIEFRLKDGEVKDAPVMSQKVFGKTDKEILAYSKRFVRAIQSMPIPVDLTIVDVTPVISK